MSVLSSLFMSLRQEASLYSKLHVSVSPILSAEQNSCSSTVLLRNKAFYILWSKEQVIAGTRAHMRAHTHTLKLVLSDEMFVMEECV